MRDSAVDLVKAFCLLVVVGLHTLMGGITVSSEGPTISNALAGNYAFAWATWGVQVMPLFFLLGGLTDRLVYLAHGLAFILGFIGAKLIFHAMHEYGVAWAPEIPIWLSLAVIAGTLVATTIASLAVGRKAPGGGDKAAPAGPPMDAHADALPDADADAAATREG